MNLRSLEFGKQTVCPKSLGCLYTANFGHQVTYIHSHTQLPNSQIELPSSNITVRNSVYNSHIENRDILFFRFLGPIRLGCLE